MSNNLTLLLLRIAHHTMTLGFAYWAHVADTKWAVFPGIIAWVLAFSAPDKINSSAKKTPSKES